MKALQDDHSNLQEELQDLKESFFEQKKELDEFRAARQAAQEAEQRRRAAVNMTYDFCPEF